MTQPFINSQFHRTFYQLPLGQRVILTQLPLTVSVLVAAGLTLAYYPQTFAAPFFGLGLWLQGLTLLACCFLPWERLPRGAYLLIPYLDLVAVGCLRTGSTEAISSISWLILFPVFWLASSGLAPKTAVTVSALSTLAMAWAPVIFGPEPLSAELLAEPLMFPFMMLTFAVTVVVLTSSMQTQSLALAAKDGELREALAQARQREQLLATVLDTVPVGLVVVDGGGHDQLMNATQELIHALAQPPGIADPEEKQLLLFDLDRRPLAPEDRPVRRAVLGEAFTNEQLWIGAGEQARAVSASARIMRDEDGASAGAVIAFHDITDMHAALAAKVDFVANVSHEFRTPLTSILGYLEMILDDRERLPAEVTAFALIAERNAQRLSRLVADFLNPGELSCFPERCDVAGLVADAVASAQLAAERNGVVLVCQAPATLFATVDAGRLGQALDNLISNAIKYSPDGGTVTVRAMPEGAALVCEVQDTGMGMNDAEQAQAFTKFFRAEGALSRAIPGLGLGLLITKSIVALHRGTISLRSGRGCGTTVRIELPDCLGR